MSGKDSQKAYAAAGVDVDLGNEVKQRLPEWLAAARRPGVLGKVGGFGGLFALDTRRHRRPVLVSSVDGVGTKLKLAFALDRHDTVSQDLVNHCVNDIAALGAEPLFFLDYIAAGRLRPEVFEQLIKGFSLACRANRCALIGGETAQMPGFYAEEEYDLSGAIVGIVERDSILDGKNIRRGDVLIGLASSGLHTNGYSLARKVLLDQARLKLTQRIEELGCELGEELLKIHVSYGPLILRLLRRSNREGRRAIKAIAHITGGGFVDNIPRVLPKRRDALVRKGSWPVPPIFRLIQRLGRVEEAEMWQVFNMGVGMILIVDPEAADKILRAVRRAGLASWTVGEIVPGTGRTRLV